MKHGPVSIPQIPLVLFVFIFYLQPCMFFHNCWLVTWTVDNCFLCCRLWILLEVKLEQGRCSTSILDRKVQHFDLASPELVARIWKKGILPMSFPPTIQLTYFPHAGQFLLSRDRGTHSEQAWLGPPPLWALLTPLTRFNNETKPTLSM